MCLLTAVFCPLPLLAVDTLQVTTLDPILEDWRWTVFDESDGLAGRVYDVYEDGEDVWFGTSEGAQHYDGFRWTTYTTVDGLVDNRVRSVIRDRDGAMWFGTGGGISRLTVSEAGEQEWTSYTFKQNGAVGFGGALYQSMDGSIWAGFASDRGQTDYVGVIRRFVDGKWLVVEPTVSGWRPYPVGIGMIQASDGMMWFWGLNGVLSFDGTEWALELEEGITADIIEAANGHIWAVDYGGDVLRYVPGSSKGQDKWTRYSKAEVGILHPYNCWQDEVGTIWVSGSNRVARFQDGSWFTYPRFVPERLLSGNTSGKRFRDGITWLWSANEVGAARFQNDSHVSYFSHGSDSLHVGPEGPDGSMWFRTPTSVIRRVDDVWKRHTPSDGFLNGRVRSLTRARDGSVWAIGQHEGMGAAARYLDGRWTVFTEADGVIDTPEVVVAARGGGLWVVGTHKGSRSVSYYDGQSWALFDSQDRPDSGFRFIRAPYEASDGSLWIGGYAEGERSIHRLDVSAGDGNRWTPITNDRLIGYEITGFTEWPVGTLWVGSSNGLHRIEMSDLPELQASWTRSDLKDESYKKYESFVPTVKGLWFRPFVRANAGAFYYDGQTFEHYTMEDGLADNAVRHIFSASDGAVWFVGETGVSRLNETGAEWTRFTSADGIRTFPDRVRVTKSVDGSFWMDVDGKQVLHFRYHEPPVPETYMQPAFDEVSSAGNILLRWSGTTKWNQRSPDDLKFRWRLSSSDPSTTLTPSQAKAGPGGTGSTEWTETKEKDVTFTALAPGSYRFEVLALSPAMRTDPTPAVHAFIVDTPWWQKPVVAGPGVLLLIIVMIQSARVVRRDRALISANRALSDANNELFSVNTNLQRANEEIQQQTERKSAFLASMSHELRTPMNAIKGFTNLVLRRGKDELSERNHANLQKVSQASDHLLAQIDDLLDLSKIEAGKMDVDVKLFDVREMIEYCVSTVSPLVQDGVELKMEIDSNVSTANTDEQRVRQMVINLLSNAVKFTDEGSVTVSAVCASLDMPSTASTATRDERSMGAVDVLVVSVSDTGMGIPEEELSTLFDEYRQVAGQSESEVQRGTGLGLSITKKFAELLGGRIEVESEVGKGSVFTVRIPVRYQDQ